MTKYLIQNIHMQPKKKKGYVITYIKKTKLKRKYI